MRNTSLHTKFDIFEHDLGATVKQLLSRWPKQFCFDLKITKKKFEHNTLFLHFFLANQHTRVSSNVSSNESHTSIQWFWLHRLQKCRCDAHVYIQFVHFCETDQSIDSLWLNESTWIVIQFKNQSFHLHFSFGKRKLNFSPFNQIACGSIFIRATPLLCGSLSTYSLFYDRSLANLK